MIQSAAAVWGIQEGPRGSGCGWHKSYAHGGAGGKKMCSIVEAFFGNDVSIGVTVD